MLLVLIKEDLVAMQEIWRAGAPLAKGVAHPPPYFCTWQAFRNGYAGDPLFVAGNVHFSKHARIPRPRGFPRAGQPPSVARPVTAVNTLAERDNSRARPEPVGLPKLTKRGLRGCCACGVHEQRVDSLRKHCFTAHRGTLPI